jgi:GST-like protein
VHKFLSVRDYAHLLRWYERIAARPAVARGRVVNRTSDTLGTFLREHHDASGFREIQGLS